ncbi:hypothetical protein ADEAN_000789600 [Angomonas deanei]|uniref:Uncharacterized protein n=1 Tax=Angomonas deanei TaxID=59799 RepID=A0A7G2CKH5_9TRYP|nr:hypothetical protein ADEAN_000789600 [Angomonas deanei]
MRQDSLLDIYGTHSGTLIRPSAPLSFYRGKVRLWKTLCDLRTDLTRVLIVLRWRVALLRSQTQSYKQREEDIQTLLYRQLRTSTYGVATAKEDRILTTLMEEEPDIPSSATDEEGRLLQWSHSNPYLSAMVAMFLATVQEKRGAQKELLDSAMKTLSSIKQDGSESLALVAELEKTERDNKKVNFSFGNGDDTSKPKKKRETTALPKNSLEKEREREQHFYSLILLWSYAASSSGMLKVLSHATRARNYLYDHFIISKEQLLKEAEESDESHYSEALLAHPHKLILRQEALGKSSHTVLLMFCRALMDVSKVELEKVKSGSGGYVYPTPQVANSNRQNGAVLPETVQRISMDCAYRSLLALKVANHVYQQAQEGGGADTTGEENSSTALTSSSTTQAFASILECSLQIYEALHPSLTDTNYTPYVVEPLVALCYTLLELKESYSTVWSDPQIQLLAFNVIHSFRAVIHRMPPAWTATSGDANHEAVLVRQLLARTMVKAWNSVLANPTSRQVQYMAHTAHENHYVRRVLENGTSVPNNATNKSMPNYADEIARLENEKQNALLNRPSDDEEDAENAKAFPGDALVPEKENLPISDRMPIEFLELMEEMLFDVELNLFPLLLPHYVSAKPAANPTGKEKNSANNNNNVRLDPTRSQSYVKQLTDSTHSTKYKVKKFLGNDGVNGLPEVLVETAAVLLNAINSIRSTPATVTPASGKATTAGLPLEVLRQVEEAVAQYKEDPLCPKVAMRVVQVCLKQGYYTSAKSISQKALSIIDDQSGTLKRFAEEVHAELRKWLVKYNLVLSEGGAGGASARSSVAEGSIAADRKGSKKKKESAKASVVGKKGLKKEEDEEEVKETIEKQFVEPQRTWTAPEQQMLRQLTRNMSYLRRRIALRYQRRRFAQFCLPFQAQLRLFLAVATRLETEEKTKKEAAIAEKQMWALAASGDVHVTPIHETIVAESETNSVHPTSSKGRKALQTQQQQAEEAAAAQAEAGPINVQVLDACTRAATLYNYCLFPARAAHAVQSAVDDIRHYIAQHVPDPLLLFNLPALGATLGDATRSNAEDGDAYGDGESPSKVNQINIDSTVQFSTKEIQEELKTVSPQIYALAVELLCALGHVLYGYCDHRQDIEFQQSAAIKVGRFISKNNPTAFAGYEPSLYVYVSPAGQHEERKHALRSRMEHRRQQRRNQRQLTECEEDEATTRDVVVMTHQSELYNLVQNYSEHIPELEDVLPVLRADMLAWHQEHALNENDGWGKTDRFNTKYQHKEDGGESELPDVVGRSQGDDLFATILTFPYPQAKSRKHTSTVSVALQEMILQQQYGKDIPEELMMHSLFFLIHCLQWSMPLKVASLCQNANALTSGRYALMLLPLERWAHQVVSTGVTPHMTHLERDLFTTLRDTPTGMKLLMFARHAWKRYTHTDAYKRSRRRVRLTAHRENTFLRKVTRHHSFNAEESAMSSVTANSGALIRQTLKGVVSLYQEAEAQLRERRELSLLGQCLLEMGYVYIQHNRRSEAEQSWLRALDSFLLVPQVLGRWCKKEFPLRCAKPERVVTREVLGGAFAHTVESELDTKAVNFSSLLLALNALGALSQYCYCDQQTRATDAAVLAGHLLQEYLTCSKAISYALPTRMCDFADINLRDLAAVLSPAWQPELREQLPHTAEQLLFLSHQLVEAGIDFHHAMLLASLSEYIAYHHVQQTEAVVNARLVRVRAAIAVGNTRAGLYLLQQICLGAGLPAPSLSHLSLSGGVVDQERHTIVSLVPPSGEAAVVFNSVSAAGRKLSKMEERRKSSQGAATGNANSNKNDTSSVAWCVYNNSLPAVSEENLTALRSFLSLSLPNLSVEEVLKKGENEKEKSGVAPVSLLHECIVSHYGYLLSMRVVLTVVEVLTSISTQYALERWPTAATEVATSRPSSSKGATTATPSLAVAQSTTAEAAKVAEYIADLFLTSPSEEGGDTVAKKSTKPQASKTKGDKNNSNANATAQEGATVDEEELFYAVQRVEAHASLRHKVSLYKAYLLYAKGESESLLSIVADEIGAYNRLREVFSSEGEKEQGGGGSSLQSRGLSLITLPNVPTFLITLNHFHWCRLLECAAREYLQLRQYNALVLSSVEQVTALCSLCGDIYTPVSSLVLNTVALLLQGKTQKAVETFHLVERVIQSGALPVSVNPYAGWAASTAVLMEASGIAEIGSTGVKEDHSEDDEEEGKNGGVDRVLRLMYLYFRGLEFNSSFAYNSGVDVSFFDITKLFRFPKRGKPLIVKLSDQFNFDLTSVRHDMVIVPKRLPLSISRSSVYAVPLQNILNIITNRFIQRGFASPDDLEAFEQQKNNIWNSRFVLGNFMQHTNMLYDFKNHPTSFTRSKLTLARATIAYHSLSSTKPLGEEQFANVVEMLQEVVQEHIQGGIHHYGDVRTALLELSVLYVLHEEEEPAHRDAAVTSLLAACVVEDMARRVFTRTATYQDYSTDESMMTDWATLATRFPPQVLTLLQSSAAVTTSEGAASVAHLSAEAANAKTGKKTAARADSGGRRNSKTSATASELSVKGEEQNRFQNLPPVRLFEIVRTFAKLYHEHELYSLVAPADLQAEQEMGLRLVKRFLQEKSSALNCTYLCYPDELRHVIFRTLNPQRVAPPSGSGKRSGGVAAGALQLALDNVEIWGSLVPPILLTSIPSDMFSASPAEVLGAPSVNSVAAASFTSTSLDTGHYNANSNWTHNAEDGTITLVLAVSPLQDFSMSCAPSIASAVDRKRLLKTIPAATGSGDKHGGGHPDASKSRVPSVDNAMADRLQELQTDSTSNASWRPVVFQFSCKTLRALHGEVCTALELLDQNEDESHVVAVPPNPGAEATARSAKGSRRSSSVVATLDPSSVPPLQCGEGPAQQNLSWALAEASLALQQRTGGPNSTTLAGGGGRKRSGSFAKSVPEQRPTTSLGGSSAGASNNYVLCDMEKKRREDRKLEEMEERNDINVQLDMKKADVIVHFLEALIRSTYTPEEQSREALSSEHWLDETVDRLSPHCAVDRGLLKFLQEWLYCGETEKENGEPTDNAESGVEEEVVLGATGKVKKIIKRRRQADAEKERLNGVLGRRNDVSSTDNTGGSSVSFFNPGIHEWMTRIVDYLEERKNVKKAKKNIK